MMTCKSPLALGALAGCVLSACGAPEAEDEIHIDKVATTAQALDQLGDGISSPLEIPLVLVLWEHPVYGGTKSTIIRDQADLRLLNFNDKASAIGVHPGPSYDSWRARHGGAEPTVSLYADGSFTGSCARLSAGAFSRTADFGFNDNITSVRFNDGVPCYRVTSPYPAATISYVPFAVELYADPSFSGVRTTIVQQTSDLRAVHGAAFNDSATALRILRGPNYSAGLGVQLHRDTGFADIGYPISGAPYLNGDLRSINFNDNISGIRFR